MKIILVVLQILYDVVMVGLGSYGAYILFREFVELEHFLPISHVISILRKRWAAFLAIFIALILFFLRLQNGLNG